MRDALRFLTTLPMGAGGGPPAPSSVQWFPFAGFVVGLGWTVSYAVANSQVGPFVAAAVVLVVDALLTGGLHLDALADVADGLASRRPPDEAIAIMRQPVVGAIGAAALVLVCVLRVSILVLAARAPEMLVVVPVAGRAAMALLLSRCEIRPGPSPPSASASTSAGAPASPGSLAAAFGRPDWRTTGITIGFAVLLVLTPALSSANPVRLGGLACLAVALVTAAWYARWWRGRFGELTGDGVGAGGLVAETLALLVLGLQLDRV